MPCLSQISGRAHVSCPHILPSPSVPSQCSRPGLQTMYSRISWMPLSFSVLFAALYLSQGSESVDVACAAVTQLIEAYVILVFWSFLIHLVGGRRAAVAAYGKVPMASPSSEQWIEWSSPDAHFDFHRACILQLLLFRPVCGAGAIAWRTSFISTPLTFLNMLSMLVAMLTLLNMYRGLGVHFQHANGSVLTKFSVFKGYVGLVLLQIAIFNFGVKFKVLFASAANPAAAAAMLLSILVVIESLVFAPLFCWAFSARDELVLAPLLEPPRPLSYCAAVARLFAFWDVIDAGDSSMMAAVHVGAAVDAPMLSSAAADREEGD